MIWVEPFPLKWPSDRPRTRVPMRSRFTTTTSRAWTELRHELRLLGAKNVTITSDIPLTKGGTVVVGRRSPEDKGVAVWYLHRGNEQCLSCDRWDRLEDNVHAIAKCVEAMRGLDRWGGGGLVERAMQGIAALPEAVVAGGGQWNVRLGVSRLATKEEIESAYRRMVKQHHPDVGGDPSVFVRVNQAYQQGLEEIGS